MQKHRFVLSAIHAAVVLGAITAVSVPPAAEARSFRSFSAPRAAFRAPMRAKPSVAPTASPKTVTPKATAKKVTPPPRKPLAKQKPIAPARVAVPHTSTSTGGGISPWWMFWTGWFGSSAVNTPAAANPVPPPAAPPEKATFTATELEEAKNDGEKAEKQAAPPQKEVAEDSAPEVERL